MRKMHYFFRKYFYKNILKNPTTYFKIKIRYGMVKNRKNVCE